MLCPSTASGPAALTPRCGPLARLRCGWSMRAGQRLALGLWLALPAVAAAAAVAPIAAGVAPGSAWFARVGDVVISQDAYDAAFAAASRARFYHGKPPDAQVAALQREVAEQVVVRQLVLRETQRRGLRPDTAAVQHQVTAYAQRYAHSEPWKTHREQLLPPLQARLEQDDLLAQIAQMVRAKVQPSEAQVRAYFAAHPDKFTEPEQLRVAVILLRVDPSSSDATWLAREAQAQALLARLRAGASFAALAREYSAEASGPQGGDMGYLHSGMLPEGSQAVLQGLPVGGTSEPVRLLEGVALFRLSDRKPAKAHSLEQVHLRAQQLAQRELADAAWNAFVNDLKSRTAIHMDQSRFLPLAQ